MIDMTGATKDAFASVGSAVKDVMPATPMPKPIPELSELWSGMTGRGLVDLSRKIGPNMTSRFIRYMMKKEGRF